MFVQLKDFPDYVVDSSGDVYSLVYRSGKIVKPRWFKLKPHTSPTGYLSVALYKNGKAVRFRIHQLVMLVFVGARDTGLQINHLNGIKTDNRIENLEYCTQQENLKHAALNGLNATGERHGCSKLTKQQVLEIRSLQGVKSGPAVAKEFGVNHTGIYKIWKRRLWANL